MSSDDNARKKAEGLESSAEEKAGESTNNEEWQAEGKSDKAKGGLKQAGEKIKGAFGKKE